MIRPATIVKRLAAASTALEFDAESHAYCINGAWAPSVTQILNKLVPFEWTPPEWAKDVGSAIHMTLQLYDEGVKISAHELIEPYLDEYKRFLAESDFEVIASETRLSHPILGYAGTFDRLYWDRRRRQFVLCDFKRGRPPMKRALLQLYAYELLVREAVQSFDPTHFPLALLTVYWSDDGERLHHQYHASCGVHGCSTWINAVRLYKYLLG